jgi:tetratricopeptide (TPR) repeat protein
MKRHILFYLLIVIILFFSGCATDFSKGTYLLQKGQYDQSIDYFDRAIGQNPGHSEAYNNRGLAYRYKAQYEKAISDFSKAIEINPNDDYAYNNRGDVLALKGHFNKAIADYNKTIEINPNNSKAYNTREYVRVIINVENYAILLKEKSRDTDANVMEERAESLFKSLQSSESSYYLGFIPSEILREYAILLRQEGKGENAEDINSLADWWDQTQRIAVEQALDKYKDKKIKEPKELMTVKKFIKIKVPEHVSYGGKVKFTVVPGDVLEVIRKKPCLGGKGECWEVINIKTGETGFVNAKKMINRQYVYTEE